MSELRPNVRAALLNLMKKNRMAGRQLGQASENFDDTDLGAYFADRSPQRDAFVRDMQSILDGFDVAWEYFPSKPAGPLWKIPRDEAPFSGGRPPGGTGRTGQGI